MNIITLGDLQAVCPSVPVGRLVRFVEPLNAAFEEFGIDTETRQAAFLAQIAHESGGFIWLKELWGPTPAQERYEPPALKAKELGNTNQGDGFRYRGRGLIQVTGRANYVTCGHALHLPLEEQPELLEAPGAAARSAGWFWSSHGLNALADSGDFERITRKINGGLNGLADRLAYWERAKEVLA